MLELSPSPCLYGSNVPCLDGESQWGEAKGGGANTDSQFASGLTVRNKIHAMVFPYTHSMLFFFFGSLDQFVFKTTNIMNRYLNNTHF